MLVIAVFIACGSKKEPTFSITITPSKSYVNQTVNIKAQNEEGLSDAFLIYPKGTMIPMKKTNNSLWELDFVLPAGKVDKINLEVVGKPKDGSPAITQSFEYEIMEYPTINAKVISENSDGAELEVKTSKPFKKVYIQTDDKKQITFESKGDNTYKVKAKELDLDNKGYAVNLEDENGNILKTNLIYTPDGLPMHYMFGNQKQEKDTYLFDIMTYYNQPEYNLYKTRLKTS